jgi:hypothetical protein
VRSKAYCCGRLVAANAGSKSAEGMNICLLCFLWFVEVAVSATW